MKIVIKTPLSDDDRQLLTSLLGESPKTQVADKPAPAKKAAAAKAPEPEPEIEEVVEAEIVEDDEPAEDDADSLMEQAVQKATKLVSDGKASDVKAALEKAGARRVSELKGADNIRKFLDAL